MGIPARFAVAQRSTAECLGLFAAAQRLFERRGVDFQLVAFETAAERGVEGLTAGEWDYRFGSKADIATSPTNVRFAPKSGYSLSPDIERPISLRRNGTILDPSCARVSSSARVGST